MTKIISVKCRCSKEFPAYKSQHRVFCSLECRDRFRTRGWKQSKETIEKRVKKLVGQKRNKKQRENISKGHIGQVAWNKGIVGSASHSYGRKLSPDTRIKISLRTSGKNSHWWKGGITSISKRIRMSSRYKKWRHAVFERDNWTCTMCGKRGDELHPDHIKPFSLFPEFRFDVDNGRTLCRNCHKNTDTYGSKVKKLTRDSFNQTQ